MIKYRLAPLAKADLDGIWLYVARNAGLETADRVIDSIADRFKMLAQMPRLGRLRPDLGPAVRVFPAASYLIYYRERDRGGTLIARVFHAKRDQYRAWEES